MKIKNTWKIIIITVFCLAIFGLAIFLIVYFTVDKSLKYSKENPSGIKFISERSYSLKFQEGENESEGNALLGTGWLMAQDATNSNTFYLGTNLHVAAAVNNIGKRNTFDWINYSYVSTTQFNYNYLYFGQLTSIFDNHYEVGIVEGAKSYEQKFYSRINLESVSVAWTTFEIFNNMNFGDPYKVYNQEIIQNATMDFAVLKIDFTNIEEVKNVSPPGDVENFTDQWPLKKSLTNFKNNPTKFSNGFIENQAITVAGFPAIENSSVSQWQSAINIHSDKKYYGLLLNRSGWSNEIREMDDNIIKKDYSLVADIKYITDQYAVQRNTSNQVLFSDLKLPGGSSGSMAINANNEVVGIYWGTYGTSDGQEIGAIDIFKSFSDNDVSSKFITNGVEKNYIVSKKYDIINEFNLKFKTNLNQ